MPLDFPNTPVLNDTFTSAGKTWQYNGSAWVLVVGAAAIAAGAVTSDKIGTGAVTSGKLSAGTATDDYVLMADSGEASGMKWSLIPPSGGLSTSTEGALMTMAIGA